LKALSHLSGKMLIAMPGMGDPRFDRSLIFMCAHSENGAMGIIVNKTAPMLSFGELASQLDLFSASEYEAMPPDLLAAAVLFGGPVEPNRGFVLHTSDYLADEASMPIGKDLALTATLDILRDMASGKGPRCATLALGYSGWAPGQLEDEIQRNGWLHGEADETLLFGRQHDVKYDQALRKIGIDPLMLSSDAGHA
jgi:putative transcriptional regulator